MKASDNLSKISRRDLFRVAGTYGMSSTLLAAGSFGGAMSLANLASAAESTYEKRFSKPAKTHAEIRRIRLQCAKPAHRTSRHIGIRPRP